MCTSVASAFSVLHAALVLEPELGAQQAAGVVGHAPQPCLVGALLLAPGGVGLRVWFAAGVGGVGGVGGVFAALAGARLRIERLLHALALLLVGPALGFGIGGLRRRLRLFLVVAGFAVRLARV